MKTLKLLKIVLAIGLLSIMAQGVSYANCLQAALLGDEMATEFIVDLLEDVKPAMECYKQIMINYHRKSRITEEKKQQLLEAYQQVGMLDGEYPEDIQIRLVKGLVAAGFNGAVVDAQTGKRTPEVAIYAPVEESANYTNYASYCKALEVSEYEEAFKRYIELLGFIAKKCDQITGIMALKYHSNGLNTLKEIIK